MGRHLLQSGLVVAFLGVASWAFAQNAAPHFSGSDLPPPEQEKPQAPSLYDTFSVGDGSPLGARANSVRPAELVDQA